MGRPARPSGDGESCLVISLRAGLTSGSGGDGSLIFSYSCLIFLTWLWMGEPLPSLLSSPRFFFLSSIFFFPFCDEERGFWCLYCKVTIFWSPFRVIFISIRGRVGESTRFSYDWCVREKGRGRWLEILFLGLALDGSFELFELLNCRSRTDHQTCLLISQ